MGAFEDFITLELPKRPFVETDGVAGQVLMRSSDPNKRLQLVWGTVSSSTSISADVENKLTVGSDGGLFVNFTWSSTQW